MKHLNVKGFVFFILNKIVKIEKLTNSKKTSFWFNDSPLCHRFNHSILLIDFGDTQTKKERESGNTTRGNDFVASMLLNGTIAFGFWF